MVQGVSLRKVEPQKDRGATNGGGTGDLMREIREGEIDYYFSFSLKLTGGHYLL